METKYAGQLDSLKRIGLYRSHSCFNHKHHHILEMHLIRISMSHHILIPRLWWTETYAKAKHFIGGYSFLLWYTYQ